LLPPPLKGNVPVMKHKTYDVAIIGGGAAGLSAALVLGRARRSVALIDAGEPRNAPAAHMQGFLSRDGMPPAELLAVGREEVRGYGVDIVEDAVVEATQGFTLRLASYRTLTARRLLLATGAVDELPDIPGAAERWGRDFLHCPYCHGWEVRDQPIGVIGTDPASAEYAHLLRQWSDDVVFFAHTQSVTTEQRLALDARGITVIEGGIASLLIVDDRLQGIELVDGGFVRRVALFMRPTMHARTGDLVTQLGCVVDGGGFVQTDAFGETTVAGVWAAGNAANPRAQVITAAGEGSAAAIAINNDLVLEDAADAVGAQHRSKASKD
jgi:thioredoxin reductase